MEAVMEEIRIEKYSAYKDSGVEWLGKIPEQWNVQKLKNLFTEKGNIFIDGDWIESKDINGLDVKYITSGNIGDGHYKKQGEGFITYDTFHKLNCTEVKEGDLLICRLNLPLGRCCIAPKFETPVVACVDIVICRMVQKCNRKYYMYLMNSLSYQNHTELEARGAIMKRLSRTILGNFFMPIPSANEQNCIAKFLDHKIVKIDKTIWQKEMLIELMKERRQILIQNAVTRGLDPNVPMKDSGVEWIGEIPEHWEVAKLGFYTSSIQTGPFGGQLHSHDYIHKGVPVINPSHIVDGEIVPDDNQTITTSKHQELKHHTLSFGDIVFGRRGEMGRCAIFKSDSSPMICGTGSIKICLNQKMINPFYLNAFLKIENIKAWFSLNSVGSTMENLNSKILSIVPIIVPPVEEQKRIFKYVEIVERKTRVVVSCEEKEIEKLKEYKATLINAAVTGKIKVG